MKILIVASYNKGYFVPFIVEQVEALKKSGIECEYFGIQGKGIKGYLKNIKALRAKIKSYKPDIIHAHYGLSGLLANFQRRIPVITTYHGSDINDPKVIPLSKIAMMLSTWNIFVSQRNIEIANPKKHWSLVPCGINLPKDRSELPNMSHVLEKDKKHILFAGAFDNKVKNYPLAKQAIDTLTSSGINVQLIELKGYTRDEVNSLMYVCDAFLMTSFTEGSPQVIKEAMACGCPIVSTNVGDVKQVFGSIIGNYICSYNSTDIANTLNSALNFNRRTEGRNRIIELGLTNDIVANKLIDIYKKVLA